MVDRPLLMPSIGAAMTTKCATRDVNAITRQIIAKLQRDLGRKQDQVDALAREQRLLFHQIRVQHAMARQCLSVLTLSTLLKRPAGLPRAAESRLSEMRRQVEMAVEEPDGPPPPLPPSCPSACKPLPSLPPPLPLGWTPEKAAEAAACYDFSLGGAHKRVRDYITRAVCHLLHARSSSPHAASARASLEAMREDMLQYMAGAAIHVLAEGAGAVSAAAAAGEQTIMYIQLMRLDLDAGTQKAGLLHEEGPAPSHWLWALKQAALTQEQEEQLDVVVGVWRAYQEQHGQAHSSEQCHVSNAAALISDEAALDLEFQSALLSEARFIQASYVLTHNMLELTIYGSVMDASQVAAWSAACHPHMPTMASWVAAVGALKAERLAGRLRPEAEG